MRGSTRAWTLVIGMAAVALSAGCSVNTKFVYKPAAPAAGGPKLPAKVAVLPFTDGTENFQKRGSVFSGGQFNLVKAGITGTVTALTPDLWAKSFADELVASGGFASTRFLYSASEFVDEQFVVVGTVKKAYWGATWDDTNEFTLALNAARRADNTVVWEKEVGRTWKTPRTMYAGCGMGLQCMVDRYHAEINTGLQAIFAEARADFLASIGALSGGQAAGKGVRAVAPVAAEAVETPPPGSPVPESPDQTIERILTEK